jgi:hypothetical protein
LSHLPRDRRGDGERGFIRYLITFGAGIATALAWQSYGDAARRIIAGAHPQLAWVAPPTAIAQTAPAAIVPPIDFLDPQEMKTISFDLAKMSRKVDQLAAAQEQMTREITKLQAVEQYVFYKSIELLPRPAPAASLTPNPTALAGGTLTASWLYESIDGAWNFSRRLDFTRPTSGSRRS